MAQLGTALQGYITSQGWSGWPGRPGSPRRPRGSRSGDDHDTPIVPYYTFARYHARGAEKASACGKNQLKVVKSADKI
jgi:hypothetical protein